MSILAPQNTTHARARAGWWDEPFAVFQTNLREIDVALDVERTLDDVQAHGADVWLLNVGGILSHYPTALPFQTRNPGLAGRPGGDLVGDALAATRRRGMRLLARMDFSKVDGRIADDHPEWIFRSYTGAPQVYEGLVSVCPRGEYYQHRLFDVVDEVLDRYGVDGFFFNWFGFNEVDYGGVVHGVCHCERCRAAWRSAYGEAEMPTRSGEPGYADWKRLSSAVIDDLTARVSAHISDRSPDAALILGRAADVLFHEANNALGRELWPWATADAVSALRVSQPEKPVLVNAVAFVDMPYRLAGEQPEMMTQYLLQAIARGANPSTYIMGPTGGIRYDGLAAAAQITRMHRDHRDVYAGLAPCADIGVVVPDALVVEPARAAQARREYHGVCAALREAHTPFDVVAQGALTSLPLDRFGVIVLPDIAQADDEWIDDYLTAGGRVVATGGSGIDAAGRTSTWHPAGRVEQTVSEADVLKSSYVQSGPVRPGGAGDVEGSEVVPRYGRAYDVEWRAQARTAAPVIAPAPYGPPEKAHGHVPGSLRALGAWKRGEGEVLALTWTPGLAYAELGLTEIRRMIVDAVRSVAGPPLISVVGHEGVEVVVGRSDAGLVIHLLNATGIRRNSFGPVAPVRDLALRIDGHSGARARALVDPAALRTETDGDDLIVTFECIGEVEVIVIGDGAADAR